MSLHIQRLSVDLGATAILRDVDLRLPAGALSVLIGPNGAGKSTLLRAAAGLVRSTGAVSLDSATMDGAARQKAVAYMPQDVAAASSLTLLETVLLGRLQTLGFRVPSETVAAAHAALQAFGLGDLHARTLDAVSGGQRQLAYLAQALFRAPRVLLLDEPTSALDLRHQLLVLEAARRYARETGAVVAAAMHDLTLAAQFADRLVCLDRGRVEASGPPEQVLTPERLEAVYGVSACVSRGGLGKIQVTPLRASEGWRGSSE